MAGYDTGERPDEDPAVPSLATYVPGSSGRTFAQHQVRDGVLGLVAPLQRRDTVQSKVAVGQQQRVEEHSHRVGRASLQTLAQILQVLDRRTTKCLTTDAFVQRFRLGCGER